MAAHTDLERIINWGVIAILRLESSKQLMSVVGAIRDGGIGAIEFTVTTPGALAALKEASQTFGDDVVLGAGTILDAETARTAILAGARFIVSPTFSKQVVTTCRRYGVVSIPGALSPTEVLAAWEAGADLVKLFPAAELGPSYVKDILAPLPQVRLVPTGGVSLENASAFIEAGAAAIAVGGSLVDRHAIAAGDMPRIASLASAFRAAVEEGRRRGGQQARSLPAAVAVGRQG